MSNGTNNRTVKSGFGLIEIVVVTAVVTVALFGFLQASILSVRLLRAEKENLEATLLAQEALLQESANPKFKKNHL